MPSISSDPSAVSVGFSTKLGASVTATGVAAAIVAYISGDRSEQTLGVIAGAAVAALAFAITAAGRFAQARAQIKMQPALIGATAGAAAREQETRPIVRWGDTPATTRTGEAVDVNPMPRMKRMYESVTEAEAQIAHDEAVADHGIDGDAPDPFDGIPDVVPMDPAEIPADAGDPLTRGEVDGVTVETPEPTDPTKVST